MWNNTSIFCDGVGLGVIGLTPEGSKAYVCDEWAPVCWNIIQVAGLVTLPLVNWVHMLAQDIVNWKVVELYVK